MNDLDNLLEKQNIRMQAFQGAMERASRRSDDNLAQHTLGVAEKFPGEDAVDRSTLTRVRARFGGRDVTFQMTPDDVPAFEQIHGSAFGFYKDLQDGRWTVENLRTILGFASMSDKDRATISKSARWGMAAVSMTKRNAHVDKVLATKPIAIYSGLARLILASAIFGIDDADAYFSDEE